MTVSRHDIIQADHKRKSAQLRKMKKKMKRRIPISKLEERLAQEKNSNVDWRDYRGWNGVDDHAYGRAVGQREARIELLEELIRELG